MKRHFLLLLGILVFVGLLVIPGSVSVGKDKARDISRLSTGRSENFWPDTFSFNAYAFGVGTGRQPAGMGQHPVGMGSPPVGTG